MRKRFTDLGCREVYENFTVKTLAGDEILMKDATVWQLLNLPIDDAIDLFENLLDVCRDVDESVTFDYLFGLVKDQTMEELGSVDFFDSHEADYEESGLAPHGGRWFVPGSRHYSWSQYQLNYLKNILKLYLGTKEPTF